MNSSAPKVSVIMNCLNSAEYLPEALESLRAQTMTDYEVIFWDNGSTDASGEIARTFDSRLKYFYSAETVPLGAARNLALAKAKAPFIAFLDCDDLWMPAKLEKQLAVCQASKRVGLVCTDTEVFDGKRKLYRIFSQSRPARGYTYPDLLERQWISMSSAMIRAVTLDVLKEPERGAHWFDERLNVCEEADLFYRIAHDWDLEYIDEPLTLWRVHGTNTTFKKFAQFACETRIIVDKHKRLFPDVYESYPDLEGMLRQRAAFQEAVAAWRDGDGEQARKIIAPFLSKTLKHKLFWCASFLPGSFFDMLAKIYFALPKGIRR